MADNWNAWQNSVAVKQAAEAANEAAEEAAKRLAEIQAREERIALLNEQIKVLNDLYNATHRTSYRRDVAALSEELDTLMRERLATDEESTPLDRLNEIIYDKEQAYEKSGNIFDKRILDELKAHAATGFDANGQELPLQIRVPVWTQQVSPEEVLEADGYWNIQPTGYGNLPYWISNVLTDGSAGLDVSVRRSNGCMQVRNQVEVANDWVNNAQAVADQYGISVRIVRMAGYAMMNRWYLLPTSNLQGGGTFKYDDFAVTPPVPFNEAENDLWVDNWLFRHRSGGLFTAAAAGAKFLTHDIVDADKQPIDLAGLSKIFLVVNHPNLVVPAMMAHYNTHMFKKQEWRLALQRAHKIDAGHELPVLGYEKVTITGKDKTAWYAENGEATHTLKQPEFNPGSER